MLTLTRISQPFELMARHYTKPGRFVGRSLCYAVSYNGKSYGAIVAGSSTKHLPGRWPFFGKELPLNNVVNNIFFHIEAPPEGYPCRNFAQKTIKLWRQTVIRDWRAKYNDEVLGFETLVELPRTGDCYRRDGWTLVGQTKGYTCKRVGGAGTDSWTGKRVWDTKNLRPKLVFCRKVEDNG